MSEELTPEILQALIALELKPGVSREQVVQAYRDQVKVWHPDRFSKESERLRKKAEDKTKALNAAYALLRTFSYIPASPPPTCPAPASPPPERTKHPSGIDIDLSVDASSLQRVPCPARQLSILQVSDSGFTTEGQFHRHEEVAHLVFSRTCYIGKWSFTTKAESASLHITLTNGTILKVSFGAFLMGIAWDKRDIQTLIGTYAFLAERTFLARLQSYLDQIRSAGFFVYDNCRFYPREKIVRKNKEFPLKGTTFAFGKTHGFVGMKREHQSVFEKICLSPGFDTQTDTDVIFYLLERYFGIRFRWEKGHEMGAFTKVVDD